MSEGVKMAYPVAIGQIDPVYEWPSACCLQQLPQLHEYTYVCTRSPSHDGPHVAHNSSGRVLQIHPDIPEDMQVDEGL